MILILIRFFELALNLLLINYSLNFYQFELPLWFLVLLFLHIAFVISKVKVHFTFIDALQIPVALTLGAYVLGFDIGYLFSDYGNIPLYIGLIGTVAVLPRIHGSWNQLKKV